MTISDDEKNRIAEFAKRQVQAIWQDFAAGVPAAVDDIRAKLVEEPWFGRETTDQIADIKDAVAVHSEQSKWIGETRAAVEDFQREHVYGKEQSAEELDFDNDAGARSR